MTCERVIIIHEGRVVAVDTPENLMARLQKTVKTEIHIKGVKQEIGDRLKTIPGVIAVVEKEEVTPGIFSFEVEAAQEEEIGGELASLVHNNNWQLVEMRAVKMSLENIFIELTKTKGA
jgi:ABC-2 type transport system ATP-binding protein